MQKGCWGVPAWRTHNADDEEWRFGFGRTVAMGEKTVQKSEKRLGIDEKNYDTGEREGGFQVLLPRIPDRSFVVPGEGALNDGCGKNTQAIQQTIDRAAEAGGGRVILPPGIWYTGPIRLRSGIDLHLESGAVLLFSKSKEEYPLVRTDFEGMGALRTVSPILAEDAEDVAITGRGVIDGSGQLWRPVKRFKMTEPEWRRLLEQSEHILEAQDGQIWFPTESSYEGALGVPCEDPAGQYDYYRPVMVQFMRCRRVLVEGVTLQNSPAWNLHPCFCEHVTVRNAVIRNPYYAQNGDGLDLESCRYAEIAYTSFDVGDDAICLKSGKGAEARRLEFPTEYVDIHDCTVYHGHGGFVVGSEMSRGVRHVTVRNCCFMGTDVGIRFKSAYGRGGVVEDILIRDIRMTNIVKEAVIFTMNYTLGYEKAGAVSEPAAEDIPYFRDVTLERIVCLGAELALRVEGLSQAEDAISKITIRDSYFEVRMKDSILYAQRIYLENIKYKQI